MTLFVMIVALFYNLVKAYILKNCTGKLGIVDHDKVELSNMHRQV